LLIVEVDADIVPSGSRRRRVTTYRRLRDDVAPPDLPDFPATTPGDAPEIVPCGVAEGSDVGNGRVAQRAGRPGDVGEGGGDHEVAAPGQHPAVAGEVPAGYVDGNLVAVSVAAAVDRD
jgi:hypothetical protein